MTDTPAPSQDADGWDLPGHWTQAAQDAFLNVTEERKDLDGAELASLEQAAELITSADLLDEAARAEGLLVKGSTRQTVVNPGVVEARLARTAASAILARLVGSRSGAKTSSQRARDAARARWSN